MLKQRRPNDDLIPEENMDEMMLAIQEAYIDAKKRNKKYTPQKYLKQQEGTK